MPAFICTTCGTQYPPADAPPSHCAICDEERQYVPPAGQTWTTLDRLPLTHVNGWHEYEPGVIGIVTQPRFGIGQRAMLLQTEHGNVLWDCVAMLDAATITVIKALGGLQAMAISHPHFYTTMVEWGRAFGVPVHLHAKDQEWIMRPDTVLKLWDGDTFQLLPDVTLIHGGGHFEGSSMLHWSQGAGGRGLVCSGDTVYVGPDRKSVSFMRSYPNFIPLPAHKVERIVGALAPFEFDAIYGVFAENFIATGAKVAVEKSGARYLAAIASR